MTDEPFYLTLASFLHIHLAEIYLTLRLGASEKRLGDDKQRALIAALQEGLETSLGSFHLEKVHEDHFKASLKVSCQNLMLSMSSHILIDPRPDTRIDIDFNSPLEFQSEGI